MPASRGVVGGAGRGRERPGPRRPEGMEAGLAHELDFNQGESTFPFGTHVAVVEVDTETGRVELIRHIAVDDCGRILNPLLVAGQQHGGIAQGAAQALFEHVQYDDDGNPVTANLMDYAMPSAAELPSFEVSNTETPTPLNPLGAKGIGESGTIGSTPAVQNAVVDALTPFGIRHLDMPASAERVWQALQAAKATAPSERRHDASQPWFRGAGAAADRAAVRGHRRALLRRLSRRGVRAAHRAAPRHRARRPHHRRGAVRQRRAFGAHLHGRPRDMLRVMRAAEARGDDIVGVWHSHTHTDAYPSPTDVRLAVDPSWICVIVSLRDGAPVLRAYRIRNGAIAEIPITLEG